MNFNWDGFTAEDFTNHCAKAENDMYDRDSNYIGYIKVGGILFEIIVDENEDLAFDMFVANGSKCISVGTAYPFEDLRIDRSYDDFVEEAEEELERFIYSHDCDIEDISLVSKAIGRLHDW